MKSRKGRLNQKADSPRIGRWLKWYFERRTCRLSQKHAETHKINTP